MICLFRFVSILNVTKYSRQDRVKFVEDSLLKIWPFKTFKGCLPQTLLSILEYFVPNGALFEKIKVFLNVLFK